MKTEFSKWAISQHANTNHYYDKNLPYDFHLQMVVNEVMNFRNLISIEHLTDIVNAAWGHDLIEDTRTSYNDLIKNGASEVSADIIYALTNNKGKNRKERANSEYYKGIRNTDGACFVKMCDRIANVKYGVMTGSKMVEMYKKENENFISEICDWTLNPMRDLLEKLFTLNI